MNIKELIALICMLAVFGLTLYNNYKRYIFSFIPKKEKINPDFTSMLIAVVIMASLQIRGYFPIDLMLSRLYLILIWLLDIWFLSSLIRIALDKKLLFNKIDTKLLIGIAIAFSYLGMKSLSCYTWIIVCLLVLWGVKDKSEAMGVLGAVFILLAYLSLCIQATNPIFSDAFIQLSNDFKVVVSTINTTN